MTSEIPPTAGASPRNAAAMREPEPAKISAITTVAAQRTDRKAKVTIGASMSDVPCLTAQP
jgi:hypothetical protein